MAKYGFFLQGVTKPALEFEGDRMKFNTTTGIVEIVDKDTTTVGVIRLAEGQCVKEITSEAASSHR
jgi:hypothetical protein